MIAYDVTLTYGKRTIIRRFHADDLDSLYGVVHQLCPRARIIGPTAIRRAY